jgi:hypothetical protein
MDLKNFGTTWPEVFTRKTAELLTGGGVNARTLANLDSQGKGPPKRFRLGRKTMYRRDPFLDWLSGRVQEAPTPGTGYAKK